MKEYWAGHPGTSIGLGGVKILPRNNFPSRPHEKRSLLVITADTIGGYGNNGSLDWGRYNKNHLYSTILTGNGEPLQFVIYDIFDKNNGGGLTVKIYELYENMGSSVASIVNSSLLKKYSFEVSR